MKTTIAIALLLASSFVLHSETKIERGEITGNDLVSILNLNVQKTKILFDTPRTIFLRVQAMGDSRDFPLNGATKTASLMTYIPAEGGPIKPLHFWLSGDEGAIASSFAFDSSKTKVWKSEIIDGTFTIRAFEDEKFTEPPTCLIQVLSKPE